MKAKTSSQKMKAKILLTLVLFIAIFAAVSTVQGSSTDCSSAGGTCFEKVSDCSTFCTSQGKTASAFETSTECTQQGNKNCCTCKEATTTGCPYDDGTTCTKSCCIVGEKCAKTGADGYSKCNTATGVWEDTTYPDSTCTGSCDSSSSTDCSSAGGTCLQLQSDCVTFCNNQGKSYLSFGASYECAAQGSKQCCTCSTTTCKKEGESCTGSDCCSGLKCDNQECVKETAIVQSCAEVDGGRYDYKMKGSVTIIVPGSPQRVYPDTCLDSNGQSATSGNTLREYWCDGPNEDHESVTCQCQNGVCTTEPTTKGCKAADDTICTSSCCATGDKCTRTGTSGYRKCDTTAGTWVDNTVYPDSLCTGSCESTAVGCTAADNTVCTSTCCSTDDACAKTGKTGYRTCNTKTGEWGAITYPGSSCTGSCETSTSSDCSSAGGTCVQLPSDCDTLCVNQGKQASTLSTSTECAQQGDKKCCFCVDSSGCAQAGQSCTISADCCSALSCQSGVCVIEQPTNCLKEGESVCHSNTDCCSGLTCDDNGVCVSSGVTPSTYPYHWTRVKDCQSGCCGSMCCEDTITTTTIVVTTTVTAAPISTTTTTVQDCGYINISKFNDANENGAWDAGEVGIPSFTFRIVGQGLDFNVSTGTGGVVKTDCILTGSYNITEETRAGWQNTTPRELVVSVATNTILNGVIFGNEQVPIPDCGYINISKFNDANENGAWDAGEVGIPSFTFRIVGQGLDFNVSTGTGGVVKTDCILTGNYNLTEEARAGWQNTTARELNVSVTNNTVSEVIFGNEQVPVDTCNAYCNSLLIYDSGTCRESVSQCASNSEVNETLGDAYCTSGQDADTCCCKTKTATTTTTTTTVTGSTTTTTFNPSGFTPGAFACEKVDVSYVCRLDYSNYVGQDVKILFLFKIADTGEVVNTGIPFAKNGQSGTAGAQFFCGSGAYKVSWRAYLNSDKNLENPIAWCKSTEQKTIIC